MMPNGVVKQEVGEDSSKSCNNILSFDEKLKDRKNQANKAVIKACNMAIKLLSRSNFNDDHIYFEDKKFLLNIEANPQYGLPFGLIPKLLFILVSEEVKHTQSPVLRLGKLYLNLCHITNVSQTKKSTKTKQHLYDQMLRLFSSQITVTHRIDSKIKQFDFWWNPLKVRKENFSASSTIVITPELFNGLFKDN